MHCLPACLERLACVAVAAIAGDKAYDERVTK